MLNVDDHDEITFDNGIRLPFKEICDAIGTEPADIVYIGGSLIESIVSPISSGMGNRYSDLDIFVIRDHSKFLLTNSAYTGSIKKTQFYDGFPIGVDIEIYDRAYVDRLAIILSETKVDPNSKILNTYLDKLQDGGDFDTINSFLCRLRYSISIHNDEEYRLLLKKINFRSFLKIMISCVTVGTDNIISDLLGNIEVNQLDVALYCTRKLLLNVMWAALMSKGFFADREKWIYLKFKNMCDAHSPEFSKLYETATDVFRGDLSCNVVCKSAIENALIIAKESIETILLGDLKL